MENIINYISENYIVFVIISIIVVLALIGYIYDTKSRKDFKVKNNSNDEIMKNSDELDNIENIIENMDKTGRIQDVLVSKEEE